MHFLTSELIFPPAESADRFGLVAIGGDLSPERLMLAYRNGLVPWFDDNEPIVWWSHAKRMVLVPDEIRVSKSMDAIIRKNIFKVTFNTAFRDVITNCQSIRRDSQQGTWISDEMLEAYCRLNELGFAK